MKAFLKNSLLAAVLVGGFSLLACQVTAQTFLNLHSFDGRSDGDTPYAGLLLSGNTLYGTTYGLHFGGGTIFAVNTDGTGFTNLYSFTGFSDGYGPHAGLVLSATTLYGTALHGGSLGSGSVFAINTNGAGFTNLHTFAAYTAGPFPYWTNSDGVFPEAGLVILDNTLYGTAENGGPSGVGTMFAISTNGTGFTKVHIFGGYANDGALPSAGLTLSDNFIYGTTENGGSSSVGTIFKVNTDGSGFTDIYNFTAGTNNSSGLYTNIDGNNPEGELVLSGNTLYGTTEFGGASGYGAVFKVYTDGTGFTNLHDFNGSDGANPFGSLVLLRNALYGTAEHGGSSGNGAVFAINTDGTAFTSLYTFTVLDQTYFTNSDGANPYGGLILSNNTLYGTTLSGGSSGYGTVFSLSLPVPPPQLTIIRSLANVILTWPTNATGFILQSTTNLLSPVWTTNSPAPFVVNGQNTVTNPIYGIRQFFRLGQ